MWWNWKNTGTNKAHRGAKTILSKIYAELYGLFLELKKLAVSNNFHVSLRFIMNFLCRLLYLLFVQYAGLLFKFKSFLISLSFHIWYSVKLYIVSNYLSTICASVTYVIIHCDLLGVFVVLFSQTEENIGKVVYVRVQRLCVLWCAHFLGVVNLFPVCPSKREKKGERVHRLTW